MVKDGDPNAEQWEGMLAVFRNLTVTSIEDRLHRIQNRPRAPRPPTDTEPLPGGEVSDLEPLADAGLELGLPRETVDHLVRLFGSECAAIYNLVREDRTLARLKALYLRPGLIGKLLVVFATAALLTVAIALMAAFARAGKAWAVTLPPVSFAIVRSE